MSDIQVWIYENTRLISKHEGLVWGPAIVIPILIPIKLIYSGPLWTISSNIVLIFTYASSYDDSYLIMPPWLLLINMCGESRWNEGYPTVPEVSDTEGCNLVSGYFLEYLTRVSLSGESWGWAHSYAKQVLNSFAIKEYLSSTDSIQRASSKSAFCCCGDFSRRLINFFKPSSLESNSGVPMKIVPRVERLILRRFVAEDLASVGSFDAEYSIA